QVASHDIDQPTEPGAVEDNRTDDEETEEDQDRDSDRAQESALADGVEPLRIVADRAVLDEDAPDASVADQPRQGDGEGRQPDIGDPKSIEQAGDRARGNSRQDCPGERHAYLEEPGHDTGRQTHDGRYRQVDLAADDNQRHGECDDDLLYRELEHV